MDQTNVPEYSVTEISGAVKRTLETSFGRVRIRGEITELKRYPSGHIYLSLKDENAKIAAVVWRTAVPRLGLKPENGVEVIATGRITAYGERSSYQLVVERFEYAGAGALLARIEALRVRLGAEGLFDPAGKRALPRLPSVIGLVTSPQGAVLQDIRTTIARRFPRPLLLWPVPVQGESAAERIAAAIAGFDRLVAGDNPPRPDVLIVARGGGSLEDLMAFNDEAVIRAAAACRIPLISAVGHETDTTLIDFAADRRAPTPTAAAELAVPVRSELVADLAHRAARLAAGLARALEAGQRRLDRAAGRLPDLPGLLGQNRQRLDDRAHRLVLALPNLLRTRRTALLGAERHFPRPHEMIAVRRAQLRSVSVHLEQSFSTRLSRSRHGAERSRLRPAPLQAMLRERRARLEGLSARLDSVSHEAVLARGYAMVRDGGGHPVTRASSVRPGDTLTLRFADGERAVRAGLRQGDLGL
jgi:exodeoxyribonuclease VII large subunit